MVRTGGNPGTSTGASEIARPVDTTEFQLYFEDTLNIDSVQFREKPSGEYTQKETHRSQRYCYQLIEETRVIRRKEIRLMAFEKLEHEAEKEAYYLSDLSTLENLLLVHLVQF